MKAYRLTSYEDPAEVGDIETPTPGPGQVLIQVAACGLNFADLLMLRGQYQERPPLPMTIGMEFSGRVVALGEGVDAPAVGTRVMVAQSSGGLAEYALAPAWACVPLLDAMDFQTAAGFQIAYGTSHLALSHRANLQPYETLLVFGGAGGVGLTAVEVGKVMGARVIACARGDAKLQIARDAGADHAIDSASSNLRDQLRMFGGVDVVYDPVGGDGFTAAMGAARADARMLLIGFASGEMPKIPANHLLVKNITVAGFYWAGYFKYNRRALRNSLSTLQDWHANGTLKPPINHVLPLDQTAEGLSLLQTRRSTGKVVIEVTPGL